MRGYEEVLTHLDSDLVLQDQDIIAGFTKDFRNKFSGSSQALLRPRTVADVAQIVELCGRHGVGLVPVGGNTSYCGGATPSVQGDQLLISLQRMNEVREVDVHNLSMTVEAGCLLADVQSAAARDIDRDGRHV